MAVEPGDAGRVGDRGLIEDAAALLVAQVGGQWVRLHGEFEPAAQPALAVVAVTMADGSEQPLAVSPEVIDTLGEHQRRAAAAGVPWRRLVVDCHADGRLSAYTDPGAPGSSRTRRWPRRVLAATTVGCSVAAAVVFAVAWRWGPPPRVGVIEESVPPRQAEAFAVIERFVDAMNRADEAGMRQLVCADPGRALTDQILAVTQHGFPDNFSSPEAVLEFHDDGSLVSVVFAVRLRPLSDEARRRATEQGPGGFYQDQYTLVDEGGSLKVCDTENAPQ